MPSGSLVQILALSAKVDALAWSIGIEGNWGVMCHLVGIDTFVQW